MKIQAGTKKETGEPIHKEVGSFVIPKNWYKYEELEDGSSSINITRVKVLDVEGKYIKFAKLENVIGYLSDYPVSFE